MVHKIIAEDIEKIVKELNPIISKLSGKNVLITGGSGFLGKYIVLLLDYLNKNVLDKPCQVTVLDNYITGIKNFTEENENLKFIEHDVTAPYETDEEIHYIIHAAGIASPIFYKKYKLETIKVGTLGTMNMLDLAKNKKVNSFLIFSSSEVYGDPDPKFVPTPETYFGNVDCIGARACYDESKRLGETLAKVYHEQFGTPIKILRPFNVFGPGMRFDDFRVVTNFVTCALEGKDIPVYGEGNHTRTFCYISDAIIGIFQVLLSEVNGEAFNIGNDDQEISMHALAKIVADLFDNKVNVKQIIAPNDAYAKADPSRRCPVLKKIQSCVGYEAKVDLMSGIKRFIEWAKDEHKNYITSKSSD